MLVMAYDMHPVDETGHQSPLHARPGQTQYASKLNYVCICLLCQTILLTLF